MFNKTRRKFIKGAAYSSALAIGGLSNLVLAKSSKSTMAYSTQDQTIATELVTLINHTASNVTFNSISSTGLTDIYQYLATKVNTLEKNVAQGVVILAPGEQLSFAVAALSRDESISTNDKHLFITDVLDGHIAISSDYPEFNGIFPITVFESQAA